MLYAMLQVQNFFGGIDFDKKFKWFLLSLPSNNIEKKREKYFFITVLR